jgi:hypothetical protein
MCIVYCWDISNEKGGGPSTSIDVTRWIHYRDGSRSSYENLVEAFAFVKYQLTPGEVGVYRRYR